MDNDAMIRVVGLRFSAKSNGFTIRLPCFGFRSDVSRRIIKADILAVMPDDWELIDDRNAKLQFARKE